VADAAHGKRPLVILNTELSALFAVGSAHPRSRRDRRAMGASTPPRLRGRVDDHVERS
jgi:hypothetical protein